MLKFPILCKIGMITLTITAIMMVQLVTLIPQVSAQSQSSQIAANPKILPSNTQLAKLGDKWWQWAYGLDTEEIGNPFGDNSLSCTLGQQQGRLLFLTATTGLFTPDTGPIQGETDFTRSCTIKPGTQLLIPYLILNVLQ